MNPGLIIFIIDESEIMNNQYGISTSIEMASEFVNSFISDLISRCYCGMQIMRWAYILVVGHENDRQNEKGILLSGWIDDIASQEVYESVCTDSLHEEKHTKCYPKFVKLRTNGMCSSQLNALELTYQWIKEWKDDALMNRNIARMPVPLIINISSGKFYCNDIYEDFHNKLLEIRNRIDSVVFPDGSPLVCNIVLDKECTPSMFPYRCPNRDEEANLFTLSTTIPKTLTNYYNWGYADDLINTACLRGNERLFLSNMSVDKLRAFGSSIIGFYTHEWCGMCVGQPNNLLDE